MTETLIPGSSVLGDRYQIAAKLGAGGMAVVYLAEDLKHHRKVAVKVMLPDLVASLGLDRFLREIEIVAQLHHPNILALIDSGYIGAVPYYVMPYVEGESLRDRITRERQMAFDDMVDITKQVAAGLSFAHSRGLVHRDIKPGNVLLVGNQALLADFGIAKALMEAGSEALTVTGVAIGTPQYMSPEQAAGEPVDGRSDLYSLACLGYEMLVGEPPFTGPTAAAVLARQSMGIVQPIRVVRPRISVEVDFVLLRALASVPADRYRTVLEFSEALEVAASAPPTDAVPVKPRQAVSPKRRAWTPRAAATVLIVLVALIGVLGGVRWFGTAGDGDQPRLVVLPFANLGLPADEYFSAGVTEELTSRIVGISQLGVIARTSALHYKETTKSLAEIAEELDVDYVIEGSVRWQRGRNDDPDRIRVSARLIEVSEGTPMWSSNYDRDLEDVLTIQSSIAEQVVQALDVTILEPERRRLTARLTDEVQAYDAFLRGNERYTRSWERDDVTAAVEKYQEAVSLDPEFALAWARLARAHAWMHQLGYDATPSRLEAAAFAADRALAIDPDLAEAHLSLALYHYWGRDDYPQAIRSLLVAQRLEPGNSGILNTLANIQRRQGQMTQAIENYRLAAELNPLAHIVRFNLGETLLLVRRYAEAEPHLERVWELAPQFMDAYLQRARLALSWRSDVEAARAILREAEAMIPGSEWRPMGLFWLSDLARIVYTDAEVAERLQPGAYGLDTTTFFLARADVLRRTGSTEEARIYYDSARVRLERQRDRTPDQPGVLAALGMVYVGLGRGEDGVTAARRASQLQPVAADALDGPSLIHNLARVLTMLGNVDEAIRQLDILLSIPAWTQPRTVELDPTWEPLRADPQFNRILEASPTPLN